MKGLISIITPVYNRQAELEECIHSVLAQTYQNFEIILIDDGSTDNTPQICRTLAQSESRIKLLFGDHAGVSAARNKGLEQASGEYVFFMDSDDVIHPQLLESLVTGMQGTDAAIAGTGVAYVWQKQWHLVKDAISRDPGPGVTTWQNHEDTLRAVFRTISPINLIGGVMMRRDLIGSTKFRTDLFIGEDFWFIYENLIKGASTVFLKQKWYYGRLHGNNVSNDYGYTGFYTRFYRRVLVWKSEEAHGRQEYADLQKEDAFDVYLRCIRANRMTKADRKKICKVMKDYKKDLFTTRPLRTKLRYLLYVYLPHVYLLKFRLTNRRKN